MADSAMKFNITTTVSPDYEDYGYRRDILRLNASIVWVCFYVVAYGIIITGSVVGNQLVIWSYAIEPKLRRSTNTFILSLAIADFITGSVAIPLSIFARLFTGPYVCYASTRPFIWLVLYLMCATSIVHLVVITIDRYIAVTRPLKYNLIMTMKRCRIWVAVTWVIGLCFGSLPVISPSPNPTLWVCGYTRYETAGISAHRLGSLAIVPMMLLFMCICYVRIFAIAFNHVSESTKRMKTQTKKDQRGIASKRMMRTTVTTAIVLGAFAICWLPTLFKFVIEEYIATNDDDLFIIQTAVELLSNGNSMINPIIYGYRNELFRETYKRVINDVWCRRSKDNTKTTPNRPAPVKSMTSLNSAGTANTSLPNTQQSENL